MKLVGYIDPGFLNYTFAIPLFEKENLYYFQILDPSSNSILGFTLCKEEKPHYTRLDRRKEIHIEDKAVFVFLNMRKPLFGNRFEISKELKAILAQANCSKYVKDEIIQFLGETDVPKYKVKILADWLKNSIKGKFALWLGLTIIVLLFFCVLGLPYFFSNIENCTGISINVGETEINAAVLNNKQGQYQHEIKTLEQVLTSSFFKDSETLRDSIVKMIKKRTDDLNTCIDLTNRLNAFQTLSGSDQELLLHDIQKFVSRDENPGYYIDFGSEGQRMAMDDAKGKIDMGDADKASILAENEKLMVEIRGLKKGASFLGRGLQTEKKLHAKTIEKLKTDSTYYSLTISRVKDTLDSTKKENEKLTTDLKEIRPVRIDGMEFKPVGVSSRKNGTFRLREIDPKKGLEITFTLNSNKPTTITQDSITIVLFITDKYGQQKEIKLPMLIVVGRKNHYVYREPFDYGSGYYVVKIIHNSPYAEVLDYDGIQVQSRR
jgi:hypothetical protein